MLSGNLWLIPSGGFTFLGAKFLNEKYGVDLKDIGLPFFTIYLVSWGIGIFLGWLSSKFLKMGMGINKGRKLGLLACGLFAVPVIMVPYTESLWVSVGLIALAAGGHCGWSANIFSLMSDIFPKKLPEPWQDLADFQELWEELSLHMQLEGSSRTQEQMVILSRLQWPELVTCCRS